MSGCMCIFAESVPCIQTVFLKPMHQQVCTLNVCFDISVHIFLDISVHICFDISVHVF